MNAPMPASLQPAAIPAATPTVALVVGMPAAERAALEAGRAIRPELRYVDITAIDFYREAS
jgi:hypothetical protein